MTLLALVALGAALEPSPHDACAGLTPEGREARLCMNPSVGVALSGAGGVWSADGAADLAAELRLAGTRVSSKEGATWLQLHKVAAVQVRLSGWGQSVRAGLYEAHWRRHHAEPYLLLPTNPPARLPFPFDLSLYGSVLTWERRPAEGRGYTLETTRGALLIDLLRSPSNGIHLAVGPEFHHLLRFDGSLMVHELAPFTGGMVYLRLESDDGLWMLSVRGTLGAVFLVDDTGASPARLRGRAELEAERVLLAINDQPLSVTVRASARLGDAGPRMGNEWSASVGLSLRFFGSRSR